MEENNLREYYLNDILAAKHYPQVLRVSKPYILDGREYLRQGQYITILDRQRIELITGEDKEGRPFKVRNDRSAIVEVVEPDRIAHSLAEVASMAEHIQGIEICKELRFDKMTFNLGEKLKIEKIGKSFRGRRKNINLRRETDDKVYRLPLDVLGSFKLIAGKTKLPVKKLMNLRTLPLSAQFRNTPTSSNFPSGIVTVKGMALCDIVYILTVQEGTYTYEAFSTGSNNIYVEKCNLTIPRPILKLISNGMYVNSADFVQLRQKYRDKLSDIDSKLIEDIYAPGYYGSATYEKNRILDDHLLDHEVRKKRASTSLSLDETYDSAMRTLSEFSSNPSTPDSDKSATFPTSKSPPEVLPRHSKNREKRQTMTAIHEFNWSSPRDAPPPRVQKSVSESNILSVNPTASVHTMRHASTTSGEQTDPELDEGFEIPSNARAGSNRSTNSTRSSTSNRSHLSDRFENHPNKMYNMQEASDFYYQPSPHHLSQKERLAGRIYDTPNEPINRNLSVRTNSMTEDSGDSGIVLHFNPTTSSSPSFSITSSTMMQQSDIENEYTYTTLPSPVDSVNKSITSISTNHTTQQPPPPPPPIVVQRHTLTDATSVHKVHVDIDISNDSNNNNTLKSSHTYLNDGNQQQLVQAIDNQHEESPPPLQPRIPTKDMLEHRPDDYVNSNFIAEIIVKRVEEIRGLTQDQVGDLLKRLNLVRYVPIFSSELINGDLLLDLEEKTLINDLGMTQFDARKLFKYVHGWRPIMSYTDESDVNSDKESWSLSTVFNELWKIKLPMFARFCKESHVDGALLVDIVQGNIVESLESEHNLKMSGIELSRLRAFVLKKWRPDVQKQPETTRRISQQERSVSTPHDFNGTAVVVPLGSVGSTKALNQGANLNRAGSSSSSSSSNTSAEDRERTNSAEKRRAGSLWNRIKAV